MPSRLQPSIFHQKFIVRDGMAVLTGSTNFTTTGVRKNLNHIVIVKDKLVAREYTREFRSIRKGIFGKRSLHRSRKPLEDHYVGDVRVKPLFAPDHMPEMEFIKHMNKARDRIDLRFSLSLNPQALMMRWCCPNWQAFPCAAFWIGGRQTKSGRQKTRSKMVVSPYFRIKPGRAFEKCTTN